MSALVVSGLLMGLFGGAHCVAMCGGIASVVCGRACPAGDTSTTPRRWSLALSYNVGRVTSYAAAGAVLGLVGAAILAVPALDVVRYVLRAAAAVAMLAAGLHLIGLPSLIGGELGASLWRRVAPFASRLLPSNRPVDAFRLGLLWGLMPCGLLYGAFALAASARSAGEGALTMAAFGVGTLPVMLTMSALAQTAARWLSRKSVRRVAGAVVLGLGLFATMGLVRQVGAGRPFDASAHRCGAPHSAAE